MKYGQQLEEASEPGWSLHNIDYNALKYQIKTHTTRDQATTARAIPGQVDYNLKRFEDAFYAELCAQHDRVGLFVASKADEISRRIRHLSELVKRLIARCQNEDESDPNDTIGRSGGSTAPWIKRRRKFAKYSMQANECGNDIKALVRFVDAQTVAFRKILKKYRKWTGSTALNSRFRQNVLSSPKSFTQRDFHALQMEHQELLHAVKNAPAVLASPPNRQSTYDPRNPSQSTWQERPQSRTPSHSTNRAREEEPQAQTTYWNEYDYGSEAGDYHDDDTYAIYIDPNSSGFPDLTEFKKAMVGSFRRLTKWTKAQHDPAGERRPLLDDNGPIDYFSARARPTAIIHTDNEATEDEYVSSDEQSLGHDAGPSYLSFAKLEDQRFGDYREVILARASIIAFVAAFILLVVSGVLVATAGPGLSLQLGAGVTASSASSLFCACMGLGAMFGREDRLTWMYRITSWAAFTAVAILNGFLLVVVVARAGI